MEIIIEVLTIDDIVEGRVKIPNRREQSASPCETAHLWGRRKRSVKGDQETGRCRRRMRAAERFCSLEEEVA